MDGESLWRRPTVWLGIGVSVIALAAFLWLIEPLEIIAAARNVKYAYLLLSGVGVAAFLVLRAWRWRFMLSNQVGWTTVFHIQNIGYFLNYVLPARAGEIGRAFLIGNVPPVTLAQGLSTMVVERVLDLLFVVILLPFTLAAVETLPPAYRSAAQTAGFLSITATLMLILAANQRAFVVRLVARLLARVSFLDRERWSARVSELLLGLDTLTRWRDGLILLAMSVIVWIPIIGAYYAALIAVGINPSWASAAFTVCAAALSIAAPSSPGQVGVFQLGVTFALVQILGEPAGPSGSFAVLYHALNALIVALFGLTGFYATGATFSRLAASARTFRRQSATGKGS